jgi:putative DNA primase/helicase
VSRKKQITESRTRPARSRLDATTIPPEMNAAKRWVCWRWQWREDKNGKGKWTKVPARAADGRNASSTDPKTWTTFDEAYAAYQAGKRSGGPIDGIGFVLGDGWYGIDVDECVDVDDRTGVMTLTALAHDILARVRSYAEFSPTMTGLKVIARGDLSAAIRAKKGSEKDNGFKRDDLGLETYASDRYFTVTGQVVGDDHRAVADCQAAGEAIVAEFCPAGKPKAATPTEKPKPLPMDDQQVLDAMFRGQGGAQLRRLYDGDWSDYASQSQGDMRLVGALAFYFRKDPDKIDSAFRQSGLMRPKWTRESYGKRTINRAIEGVSGDGFEPRGVARLRLVYGGRVISDTLGGETAPPHVDRPVAADAAEEPPAPTDDAQQDDAPTADAEPAAEPPPSDPEDSPEQSDEEDGADGDGDEDDGSITVEVEPTRGKGGRSVVIAMRGEEEIHSDLLDLNSAASRQRFVGATLREAFPDQCPDDYADSKVRQRLLRELAESAARFRTKAKPVEPARVGPGPTEEPTAEYDPSKPVHEGVSDPHRLARIFHEAYEHPDRSRLVFYRGEWMEWVEGSYRVVEDAAIKAAVRTAIRTEYERINQRQIRAWAKDGGEGSPPTILQVKEQLVTNVRGTVEAAAIVTRDNTAPCWLGGRRGPDPAELVACPNGIVHLPALVENRPDHLIRPTPAYFTPNALAFPFDIKAPAPLAWLAFLNELWGDDPDSITTLQRWFGYCLVADTSLQKALMMIGPRRSGKGTICRVLKHVVGEANVASINLIKLTEQFGLSILLDKSVAIVPDCRLDDRTADNARIVEHLLNITGEDDVTVDRKYLPLVKTKLGVRFTLCSNNLPKLKDPSLALPSRFVVLQMTRSFLGKEDPKLFETRLRPELPGILLWSVQGWQDLRRTGVFGQPRSAEALIETWNDTVSPIATFVRDCCVVSRELFVVKEDLYARYQEWATSNNCDSLPKPSFCKDLLATVSSLRPFRPRDEKGDRPHGFQGLGLKGSP